MTRDELGRRLAARIADGVCWVSEAPIPVFEESSDGAAEISCTWPSEAASGATGVAFRLDKMGFPFLRQRKAVDWLLLLHFTDGSIDAHLIECKRTVGADQWREIKLQMASSVTRGLALAGALGVQIRRFHAYTAYRNDRLSTHRSPDPVFIRLPIGPGAVAREEPAETRGARLGQLDWEAAEILLEGVSPRVSHVRVPLDPGTGSGQVELSVG
jgi:hypothetical protein